ncbi:uncharacterized protein [Amphiura filiformis]|uniref:uncharacterized protein n=1 Tax=Amphiura filiformis TaxID=82378 RepID=UPI003B2153F0
MSRLLSMRFNDRIVGLIVLWIAGALYSIQVSGSVTATNDYYQCIGSDLRLDTSAVCDEIEECPFGDDEAHCYLPNTKEPICTVFARAKAPCFDEGFCVPMEWFCDGHSDCARGEDEWLCKGNSTTHVDGKPPPCPTSCNCSALSLSCHDMQMSTAMEANISSSIRFLYLKNVSGPDQGPMTSSLFLNLTKFPYLVVVMATSEDIIHLTKDTFAGLKFLRKVDLTNSKIRDIEAGTFRNLSHLDYL